MRTSTTTSTTTALRRSGARTRSLAAIATGLVLATTLAACGDDDGGDGTASDPAASASPSPEQTSETPTETSTETPTETPTETTSPDSGSGQTIRATGSAGVTEAVVVHATEAGGTVSEMAWALDTDQAKDDFASQFERGFGDVISQAATEQAQQAPDATPYAATVAVGCEGPRAVTIDAGEAGFQVVAKIAKTTKQCLAPMTYVVVFAAPDA